jgi:hypothetical protein
MGSIPCGDLIAVALARKNLEIAFTLYKELTGA